MPSDKKSDFWQRHIDGWSQSKLSQKTYCTQQDLSFSSFGYWRTRLNRKTVTRGKFIPVNVSSVPTSVNVFLPIGIRLEIPAHVLAEVLPVIVCTLQEVS